ncbi:MAG: hypothetical protein Q4D45_05915 [Lachnospiraceae bacterium]|nr:hypothetical protein [Lachnospiraceae bacterium]
MAFNLKNNCGMICDPISFRDTSNLNAEYIAELMKATADRMGVPMNVGIDTVKEGGLFGKTYPCVVITHPNPPQQYFTDVLIINGASINFYFFGNSKANYATNKANQRKGTITGSILNAISGTDEMAYQQEMLWHRQVIDTFESNMK